MKLTRVGWPCDQASSCQKPTDIAGIAAAILGHAAYISLHTVSMSSHNKTKHENAPTTFILTGTGDGCMLRHCELQSHVDQNARCVCFVCVCMLFIPSLTVEMRCAHAASDSTGG